MPLDSIHLNCIIGELKPLIVGGRIDKIIASDGDTVVLRIYLDKNKYNLLLSASPSNPKIYLTNDIAMNENLNTHFLTHLKKHILSGKIIDIVCTLGERVVIINIESRNELGVLNEYNLVLEIMGRHSNIMLVNSQNKISDSIKHVPFDVSTVRQVLPGLMYEPAPAQEKLLPNDFENIKAALDNFNGSELFDFLINNVAGLAPNSINEIIFNAGGKKENLINELKNFVTNKKIAPNIKIAGDKITDFYLYDFKSVSGEIKNFETLNEAASYYFASKELKIKLGDKSRQLNQVLNTAIKKITKRLDTLSTQNLSALDYENDKIIGEILTANLYKIKHGDKELIADNYYTDPVSQITIALDTTKSPSKQADKYFKNYKKKQKTILMTNEQIEKESAQLNYLNGISESLKLSQSLDDLTEIQQELILVGLIKDQTKSKKTTEKTTKISGVKKTEFEGYTILTGKNNTQNEALYRSSKPSDVWLHTKDYHGSHTVIVNPKKDMPPHGVILFAAKQAAKYSKAKHSEKTAVDYTFIKFVSKQKGAGLGKVNYINHKTVFVNINE